MFTDTEVGLAFAHDAEIRAMARDAQSIVDSKNQRIAALERQLAATRANAAGMVIERGHRNNALLAARIARRH